MKKLGIFFGITIVAGLIMMIVVGGGSIEVSDFEASLNTFENNSSIKTDDLPVFSLSIIKTGEAKTLEALVYGGGGFQEHKVSHAAVFIRHPKGSLLFDTGLGSNIDQQFAEEMPFWIKPLMAYEKKENVLVQLKSNNIDPNEIKIVLASHLHWDHASGIEDFLHAKVWVTKEELEWATRVASEDPGVIFSQFDDSGILWNYIDFSDINYENFPRSFDVFNDGSIVLVPLDGHTPGSFGMFVNMQSGKRFFFTGDATWAIEGIEIPTEKFWLSSLLADVDREKTRTHLVQMHHLMKRNPDLIIVPAHDHKIHEKIGFFPVFTR